MAEAYDNNSELDESALLSEENNGQSSPVITQSQRSTNRANLRNARNNAVRNARNVLRAAQTSRASSASRSRSPNDARSPPNDAPNDFKMAADFLKCIKSFFHLVHSGESMECLTNTVIFKPTMHFV